MRKCELLSVIFNFKNFEIQLKFLNLNQLQNILKNNLEYFSIIQIKFKL